MTMYLSEDEESDISHIARKFEQALSDESGIFLDSSYWVDLMDHYMDTIQYDYAYAAAEMAGETYPANTEVCISRSEVYMYTNHRDCATPIVNYLMETAPDAPQTKVLYGMYLSTGGHPKEAIEYYLLAYDDYEDRYRIDALLGDEYAATGNYGMAIRHYQKALLYDHNEPSLQDRIVDVYVKSGSFTLAAHFFDRLTIKDPYNCRLWYLSGFFHSKRDDVERAVKSLEYATYITPSWCTPYYALADVLFDAGRYEDAIRTIRRLFSYETIEDPFPYTMLGKCYHQLGQMELSCENFLKAIHYDPMQAEGWYNMALVHFSSGYKRQALEYIYKGLDCDPADDECLRLAWEIEESLHMWDEASQHLEELISHENATDEDYMDYAYFLYERGDYHHALDVLKSMRQIFDDCHEVFYHMSTIYFALAEHERGINMLKKALSLAPELQHVMEDNYPELLEALPSLRKLFPSEGEKN